MPGKGLIMDTKKTLLWITRTAVLIALLITFQWGLSSLTGGNQFVVGSAVNLVLIVAAIASGLYSGITVAIISPFLAFVLGVGPAIFLLIPFIAVGNLVLVLVWYFLVKKIPVSIDNYVRMIIALIAGAVLKFLVLYLLIAKFAISVLLTLPAVKATALSATFSLPQLVTASIGGVIAILIMPIIKKAVK